MTTYASTTGFSPFISTVQLFLRYDPYTDTLYSPKSMGQWEYGRRLEKYKCTEILCTCRRSKYHNKQLCLKISFSLNLFAPDNCNSYSRQCRYSHRELDSTPYDQRTYFISNSNLTIEHFNI